VEHPRRNDVDPALVRYAPRRRRDGIAVHLVTHNLQAQAWAIPEPAGGKVE
jgi:hypothetical protein